MINVSDLLHGMIRFHRLDFEAGFSFWYPFRRKYIDAFQLDFEIPEHAMVNLKYTSENLVLSSQLKHATGYVNDSIAYYNMLGPLIQAYNVVQEEIQFITDQGECELTTLVLKYS